MKHLTAEEIVALADRALANGTLTKAEQHASECARCRREIEFQRAICATAKLNVSSQVSRDFNSLLFSKIGQSLSGRKGSRFSGFVGNVFAFMMVVGLFGIIATRVRSINVSNVPTGETTIGKLGDSWNGLIGVLSAEVKNLPLVSKLSESQSEATVLVSVAFALMLLFFLDALLSKHSLRVKSHKQL